MGMVSAGSRGGAGRASREEEEKHSSKMQQQKHQLIPEVSYFNNDAMEVDLIGYGDLF